MERNDNIVGYCGDCKVLFFKVPGQPGIQMDSWFHMKGGST